jgi:translation initiation factor 1
VLGLNATSNDTGYNPLDELDRSEARVVIRMETRRFRKPVTIIQGLPSTRLREIATELKRKFGTGGTTKGGELLLQGDHRNHVKDELVRLGFAADHIDMI